MKNQLTPKEVQQRLAKCGSDRLFKHRKRTMDKFGVTGPQIDAELTRRVDAAIDKAKQTWIDLSAGGVK